MKDFFAHRTARGLTTPFVIVICVLLASVGSAWAGKNASVEIGFVGVPPAGFQNVLLNVQAVRINPNTSAGPGNNKWQNIPVPPGIGGAGQNAELQIDLNTSQNIPQLFNTAHVRPDTYRLAEVLLDTSNPGTLIPSCPSAPPLGSTADGCINYPIQLANGSTISAPISVVAPKNGTVAPLVLQLTMTINQRPTAPGAPFLVSIGLSPFTGPGLGIVQGTVNVSGSGGGKTTKKLRKLTVTAEEIGTNTAIASADLKKGQGQQAFTLQLPAAGGPNASASGFGTLYDLAVSGGGATYGAQRLQPLYPGAVISGLTFSVTPNQTLGNIAGQITDGCVASKPIIGATLQLLVPPSSNSGADCLNSPEQCVAVATANTDNAGDFPLPGTITTPSAFNSVPPPPNGAYAMEISAPGYDTLIVQAKPGKSASKKSGGTCAPINSSTFGSCNLSLTTAYLQGTIPINTPRPGQSTLVQVFAEQTGTNNIQSALPMPVTIRNPTTQVNFTINVPSSIPSFDLFATTIDLYQGVSDPYQGHTIAVLSPVSQPGVCNTNSNADFDQIIDCIGHGSIAGQAANANLGASVALSKEDTASGNFVQITNGQVQNQSTNMSLPPAPPTNSFAFCAPADTYQLQPVQLPLPIPDVTPLAAPSAEPTGNPVVVTIPPAPILNGPTATPTAGGPTPTPTPNVTCPTTCSNPDGSCPGICNPATLTTPIVIPPLPTATPTM